MYSFATLRSYGIYISHLGIGHFGEVVDGCLCGTGISKTYRFACSVTCSKLLILVCTSYDLNCIFCAHHAAISRLRAAIFVNLVAMREAITLRQGPILTNANLSKLQTANYLFQSALNSFLFGITMACAVYQLTIYIIYIAPGLALEAIQNKKLLWKLRPKLHKLLRCKTKQ